MEGTVTVTVSEAVLPTVPVRVIASERVKEPERPLGNHVIRAAMSDKVNTSEGFRSPVNCRVGDAVRVMVSVGLRL